MARPRSTHSDRGDAVLPVRGDQLAVRRIRWTLAIFLLLVAISAAKLVEIQVVEAAELAAIGERQRARTIELPATRGRLYDRDGDVLATSVQAATIYADPRAFRSSETPDGLPVPPAGDAEAVAAALAPLLQTAPEALTDQLTADRHFVYLARQVPYEVGTAVRELALPGIGVLTEPHRLYPAGSLAGQVVGFTDIDGQGLQGLEAVYDRVLAGTPGTLLLERAPGGLDIASGVRELLPAEVGSDLVLSLDRDIQYVAEQAADSALERFDAIGASIVVLEVATGDVLAMASAPGFDPNERGSEEPSDRRNRAVTDLFEPGSTQKALTFAAAIEEGIVTPSTTMELSDSIEVAGSTFTDAYRHERATWTVAEMIERSSNVGSILVAEELGAERLEGYLRAFGYGEPTALGFPGEPGGLLRPHEEWWGTSLPTISIGHGVAVSLVQLATSYLTLANDGVTIDPRLVLGTVGEDGRVRPTPVTGGEQVVSAGTARAVRGMLEGVIHGEQGTGTRALIEGYRMAGKTGTARKPATDRVGYTDEYVGTFVGMAPADDPQVVVAVMVDEPYPIYGGATAAPIGGEVMEAALHALRVPRDDAGSDLPTAVQVAAEQRAEVARRAEEEQEEAAAGTTTEAEGAAGDEATSPGTSDEPDEAAPSAPG
ncbi:MAG: peptidoglycan D,D-transpeptidase FtsI family protein [Nitriliruptoraceae bacterium]